MLRDEKYQKSSGCCSSMAYVRLVFFVVVLLGVFWKGFAWFWAVV